MRTCPVCNGPLPESATKRRVYCSTRCCDVGRSRSCSDCGALIWHRGSGRRKRTLCGRCEPGALTPRSDARVAVELPESGDLIEAVKALCEVNESGCWVWQGLRDRDGYGRAPSVAGRTRMVHRLVLEAKHGASLGSQHAHHICSNTSCVNPEHLQPVTHRENAAEMLARKSLLARIRQLESALSEADPTNALLAHIEVR